MLGENCNDLDLAVPRSPTSTAIPFKKKTAPARGNISQPAMKSLVQLVIAALCLAGVVLGDEEPGAPQPQRLGPAESQQIPGR